MAGDNNWERTKIRRDQVVAMTRIGKSATEIANILGITKRSVQRNRAAAGVSQPVTYTPLSREELGRAESLFDDGCSALEVARTLGRPDSTIRRHFPGRAWTRAQIFEHIAETRKLRKVLS